MKQKILTILFFTQICNAYISVPFSSTHLLKEVSNRNLNNSISKATAETKNLQLLNEFNNLENDANKMGYYDVYKNKDSGKYLSESLYQHGITYYYAELSIGTPQQKVLVDLDTGSSDAWIFSPEAKLKGIQETTNAEFDPNKSSTFVWNSTLLNIKYGIGYAKGRFGRDTWQFGNKNIDNVNFAIVDDAHKGPAIVGLGYIKNEATAANPSGPIYYENFPSALVRSKVINSNLYSVWLNSIDANSGKGEILFGAIDTEKFYDDLTIVPITFRSPAFAFYVGLYGISIGSSNLEYLDTRVRSSRSDTPEIIGVPVLLDTGCTLSYLPLPVNLALHSSLKNNYYNDVQLWGKPCSEVQDENSSVILNFGGSANITISAKELYFSYERLTKSSSSYYDNSGRNICFCGITSTGGNDNLGILGDTFLRSAYIVYDLDNDLIGIAQAVQNTDKSNIIEIPTTGLKSTGFNSPLY